MRGKSTWQAAVSRSNNFIATGLLLVAFLLAPPRAHAQTDTLSSRSPAVSLDTTLALPHVTVTARATSLSTAEAPSRITRIGPRALQRSGSQNVGRLLAARSGAFVKDYGGGGLATLSLRGAGSSQTLVLLDGHPIADPQLGQLDLSLLPTALLRSVEVQPGGGSALYGTGAVGGVVNLRTRRPQGWDAALTGGYGAYGERTGTIALSGTTEGASGLFIGGYRTSDGDYPYLDASRFPAEEVRRRGADRTRRSLFGTVYVDALEPTQLKIGGWYQRTERGLPTISGSRQRRERQQDRHLRLWADAEAPRAWGTLHLGGLLQRAARRYENPQQDLDQTGYTLTASLRGSADLTPYSHWHLRAGMTGSFSRARHPKLVSAARRGHAGVFARATGRYGALRLFPSVRVDGYAGTRGAARLAASPQLGLNWRLFALPLHIKARTGRSFRMPTFNDRYWQPGGNPDLHPERGRHAEVGLLAGNAYHHAEISVFARRVRDEIVWHDTGNGYWSPHNVGKTRALGLEASAESRYALGPLAGRGGLFYTLTDARNRSDPDAITYDQPLRYVPRHQLKGHATIELGPAALDLNARYASRRYVTSDGGPFLDPYLVADAQLRLEGRIQGARLCLTGRLENVFDARYKVVQNHPTPPRHAQIRLTLGAGL